MYPRYLIAILMALFTGVLLAGCKEEAPQAGISLPEKLVIMHAPPEEDAPQCEEERPADQGCTKMCQPCTTWLCNEDEVWEPREIDMPAVICSAHGRNSPAGQDAFVCPRDEDGYCPLPCVACF